MSTNKLCKLVKENYLSENLSDYIYLIRKGKFVCRECGRIAIDKKMLCESQKMKTKNQRHSE